MERLIQGADTPPASGTKKTKKRKTRSKSRNPTEARTDDAPPTTTKGVFIALEQRLYVFAYVKVKTWK